MLLINNIYSNMAIWAKIILNFQENMKMLKKWEIILINCPKCKKEIHYKYCLYNLNHTLRYCITSLIHNNTSFREWMLDQSVMLYLLTNNYKNNYKTYNRKMQIFNHKCRFKFGNKFQKAYCVIQRILQYQVCIFRNSTNIINMFY